jgi:hypothetical protein
MMGVRAGCGVAVPLGWADVGVGANDAEDTRRVGPGAAGEQAAKLAAKKAASREVQIGFNTALDLSIDEMAELSSVSPAFRQP